MNKTLYDAPFACEVDLNAGRICLSKQWHLEFEFPIQLKQLQWSYAMHLSIELM